MQIDYWETLEGNAILYNAVKLTSGHKVLFSCSLADNVNRKGIGVYQHPLAPTHPSFWSKWYRWVMGQQLPHIQYIKREKQNI